MSTILKPEKIEEFIHHGFVCINDAFSPEVANAAIDILWKDLPADRYKPETWTEPVIRLGMYSQQPFIDSINSPELYQIFNQLIGKDKWIPCRSVGTFPVRFPSSKEPNDTGKHVDASFPGINPSDYFEWRVNIRSRGRALLMLLLYSNVTEADAPTIIYKGSHIDVARLLYKEGEQGLSFMELAGKLNDLPDRDKVTAVGKAGTVYLCHPFLVHAAQAHRGQKPKFMAQPPLLLRGELSIDGAEEYAPIEKAIRMAVKEAGLL